ncbi:MAG: phosphoglycerate kinase [Candidatus Liptonbacteria bacterium]|nr:phosphoglycerate kinase [Candidatus Liptonbacteria bacterium]
MIAYLSKVSPKKLSGTAVVRLDFNTEDDWRIKAALPTLQFLLKHASKLVVLSHKGRPLGFQKQFSLKKDSDNLGDLLGKPVNFIQDFNFSEAKRAIQDAHTKSIFVMENLRFVSMEKENNISFAKNLASLGDYYVNDAFAVCHRADASVSAITKFLPSYAGLELEAEIKNLSKIMKSAARPLIMILGGAKMADKLPIAAFFKKRADKFLIGGALANTLAAIQGLDVKDSVFEKNPPPGTDKLLQYKNLVMPADYRWGDNKILDIGNKTENIFAERIKTAKTIVWNGPMGLFEKEEFAKGTYAIARAIAANKNAFSLVGGGETVTALKQTGGYEKISFVSTGGGAMLEFLAGKKLPGIEALMK